ncbi:heparan-alpha-glucosaminide N-acetyltransferase domain-containing protein, partial [Rhizobium sp. TRM95111]|uniref:DUF1624 domain-containing protein n=1 Tax=Rhizobium alarense TaxID=2846851 RepID=UPI001F1ACA8D
FAFPDSFIFFGILHSIAAASLVGLLLLRLPAALWVVLAIAAFALPHVARSAAFDHPALWWVGLSQTIPRSNDYVPLLPWLGPFLLGMAAARFLAGRLATFDGAVMPARPSRWKNLLAAAGRHSLAIYLLHQPLLIAIVFLASQIAPAAEPDPQSSYLESCSSACSGTRDAAFCERFCGCTLEGLVAEDLFDDLNAGRIDTVTDPRIAALSEQCTARAGTDMDTRQ